MDTKKRYRVKSRIRFFAFVMVLIMSTVTGINTILGFNDAEGQTKDRYVTVEVCYGDTIWDIAKQHLADDTDIRVAVHQIMTINNITAEELQPGQSLKIPV